MKLLSAVVLYTVRGQMYIYSEDKSVDHQTLWTEFFLFRLP